MNDHSEQIERIIEDDVLLSCIIRSTYSPTRTMFVTEDHLLQQVGFIVYDEGETIAKHFHPKTRREIIGSSEVLILLKGSAILHIFDSQHDLVVSRRINRGDIVLLINGGHSFDLLADAVFLEIKQGPYLGKDDKILF